MKAKRPHMPVAAQRDACLIRLGLDPENVEWHHDPPLGIRPFDKETGKYTPDANDPRHIYPMATEAHRERTPGDITAVAKTKRIEKRHAEFRSRVLARETGEPQPEPAKRRRPWPKRKMQGRGFERPRP